VKAVVVVPRYGGRVSTIVVTAVVVIDIVVLGMLRLLDAPAAANLLAQIGLLVAFGVLAILDLPVALAVAIVEMAVGGAGGGWTVFPFGITGRIALDAIVFVRSLVWLAGDLRQLGRGALGRYGLHATVIAVVLAVVWMPLGLMFGHPLRTALQDGDAVLFFAFTLPILAVMRRAGGAWIRSSLLVACIATAVFTLGVLVLQVLGWIPLWPTVRDALIDGPLNLAFGGQVGIMPSGAWRLYLGSGLYLQVGLALVGWRLLQRPRSIIMWALLAIIMIDVIASYTRGFWIASILALAIVVVLGSRDFRSPIVLMGGAAAILIAMSTIGAVVNFSLSDYVLQRAASTLVAAPPGGASPPASSSSGQSGDPTSTATPSTEPPTSVDYLGEIGNRIRLDQARILLGHIVRHPLLGEGFGAIAADYPYAQSYRYEISFLDLAFKTGLAGLLLFMSYPLRLLFDTARARFGRLAIPAHVDRRELAVPAAIILSILVASATNPYLMGAFGIMPILLAIAWLDPVESAPTAGQASIS
jgi:hypothetical protein